MTLGRPNEWPDRVAGQYPVFRSRPLHLPRPFDRPPRPDSKPSEEAGSHASLPRISSFATIVFHKAGPAVVCLSSRLSERCCRTMAQATTDARPPRNHDGLVITLDMTKGLSNCIESDDSNNVNDVVAFSLVISRINIYVSPLCARVKLKRE